jgi:uncharacterized protein (DUF983 family)
MSEKYVPSKTLAVLKCKCPQCQSGDMFVYPTHNLKRFYDMYRSCSVCGLEYEIEPGFFWGAMYVSYALTVIMMLGIGGSVLFLSNGKADFWTYIIPIISVVLLSSPYTYRLSRVLMLHFLSPIRFDINLIKK